MIGISNFTLEFEKQMEIKEVCTHSIYTVPRACAVCTSKFYLSERILTKVENENRECAPVFSEFGIQLSMLVH